MGFNLKKAHPSKWLNAEDLGPVGACVLVTIDKVIMEKVGDTDKPVLYMVGKKKALPLNITNCNLLSDPSYNGAEGCNFGWDTDQMPGRQCEIYVGMDRAMGGGQTTCVRIRPVSGVPGQPPAQQAPPPAVPPAQPPPAAQPPPQGEQPPPPTANDIPF